MRKFILIACAAMWACACLAGDYTGTPIGPVTGVVTGELTTAATVTGIRGKVVAVSVVATDAVVWDISTVSGYGSSLGAAKNIHTATNAAENVTLAAPVYLYNDRITFTISGAETNAAITARCLLIIER
jgi:hypothetical protein